MATSSTSESLSVLNVGTRILAKDLMDQYIRSLGRFRTHYGVNAAAARRIIQENPIDIIISEFELPDGTAFDLMHELRQTRSSYTYFILAISAEDEPLRAIAQEMGVDAILKKPFTAKDLKAKIEAFQIKLQNDTDQDLLLFKAQVADRDRDYPLAEKHYRAALLTKSENPKANHRYALYLLSKPDYEKAEHHLKIALKNDPKYVPALETYGILARKKGDLAQAHAMLSEAQRLSPLNPERPLLLAKLHLEWGTKTLETAALKYPEDIELQFMLGKFLIFGRDYARGLQILRSIQFPPQHPGIKEAQTLIQVATKLGALRE